MAGIYIHIPFCSKACIYCDFHFSTTLREKSSLVNALVKEIGLQKEYITGPIQTIYFGGGTPSLLSIPELESLITEIKKNFTIDEKSEITLEANPDDIHPEKLHHWKRLGINRISLGVQSFHEEELQWMNRSHTALQSRESIDAIKKAGFTNFSADLIYGSPFSTLDILKTNVDLLLAAQPPHISCYALTIEPKTILSKMVKHKKVPDIEEEKQSQHFKYLADRLEKEGYEHYEISNFALPGFRSRHNSNYWNGEAYLGIGPSAHSYDGKKNRRWNIANNALYINSIRDNTIPFTEEILTEEQRFNERILLSLRTSEGLDLKGLSKDFGELPVEKIISGSAPFTQSEKAILKGDRLVLTPAGRLFADGIAAALFID